jgi:hypothetical protein
VIRIERNTANAVALTLTEKRTTLSPTTYLLRFTKHDSEQTIYCICSDTSGYPDRYNLLTITEVASNPDPLAGEVTMTDGKWDYTAYDNNNSATNLDPTGLLELEYGFVTVVVSVSQPVTFTGGNSTYTIF